MIDKYFLHWPDDTGVPLEETWGAMAELVEADLSMIDYLEDRDLVRGCGDLGIGVVI